MEYCELQRWREIVDLYQGMTNVEVLGMIETKNADGSERTDADIEADIAAYTTHKTNVKGFYFNNAHGSKTVIDGLMTIAGNNIDASKFTVFGLGQPLLDKTALNHAGAPDVWVTVNTGKSSAGDRLGGDLGSWTPFSWYPYVAATNWSAVVTEVASADVSSTLSMMLDRGYGYVPETGFVKAYRSTLSAQHVSHGLNMSQCAPSHAHGSLRAVLPFHLLALLLR